MSESATAVVEAVKDLSPEEQERFMRKYGAPGALAQGGGQAVGAVSAGSLFAVLVGLGWWGNVATLLGFDPNNAAVIGFASAGLTAVVAWLGRMANEWRKDHPELARKLGIPGSAASLIALLALSPAGPMACTAVLPGWEDASPQVRQELGLYAVHGAFVEAKWALVAYLQAHPDLEMEPADKQLISQASRLGSVLLREIRYDITEGRSEEGDPDIQAKLARVRDFTAVLVCHTGDNTCTTEEAT